MYILGLTIVIVLGLLFPSLYVPVPAFWPFGLGFIAIIFISDLMVEIWRAKSSHGMSNVGHFSFCSKKDIHRIPWHNDYITIKDEQNRSIGTLTIMFLGGIDYLANIKSGPEYPIWIFPSYCEEPEGDCIHVLANLQRCTYNQLSPYLKYALAPFKKRVNTKKTPIYYGITSHMNASATPQNLKIELRDKKENELLSAMETINSKIYDQLDKQEKRKIKNIFVREKGNIEEP